MRYSQHAGILFSAAIYLLSASSLSAQQTAAFTYQGQLRDGGTNANGTYTMTFKLYDAVSGGVQIGSTVSNNPTLANGLFSVNLDFGGEAFDGTARWLDITAQAGTNAAETLAPRERLMPAPYALFSSTAETALTALNAETATTLNSSNWNASVGNYQSHSNILRFDVDNAFVLGMSSNGILVNGEIEAERIESQR